MAAAARRDIGDVPAADALEQLAELDGLVVDIAAGHVQVDRQHSPGGRARVVHRYCARLARRFGGQRAGVTGRVGAAADPAPGRQLAAAADLLAAARKRSRAALASASGTRRPALPSPNGGMFP